MKLPNWFKIVWWILLLILTGAILYNRYSAIASGQSVPADVFVFLVFVALTLVPIFSEFEFLGLKLKQEIDDLKATIKVKLGDIQNEIRNNQTQTLHQTIAYGQLPPPPPDNKLPELEGQIDRIIKAKLEEHGLLKETPLVTRLSVPDDNLIMFQVRYNIETQLRRIWEQRFEPEDVERLNRHQPLFRVIQELTKFEIIDKNLEGVLRETLSICNYAIHGEPVTANQVQFVLKNAKYLIDYLQQVK